MVGHELTLVDSPAMSSYTTSFLGAPKSWNHSLFGCFDDLSVCVKTCFCPCITAGRVADSVGTKTCGKCVCALCPMGFAVRGGLCRALRPGGLTYCGIMYITLSSLCLLRGSCRVPAEVTLVLRFVGQDCLVCGALAAVPAVSCCAITFIRGAYLIFILLLYVIPMLTQRLRAFLRHCAGKTGNRGWLFSCSSSPAHLVADSVCLCLVAQGSLVEDCLAVTLCPCCALVQEELQVADFEQLHSGVDVPQPMYM
jgi:Cys-rich protein (TIGR01571 family)